MRFKIICEYEGSEGDLNEIIEQMSLLGLEEINDEEMGDTG